MVEIRKILATVQEKIAEVYEKVFAQYIRSLFSRPSSILFLGIDNAGKTTLVNKLKYNTNVAHLPTHHPSKTQIEIGNLRASVIDMGGHKAARIAWSEYFYDCDGIVFIVDVNDTERFEEVREAYSTVRNMEQKPPIAVLMNKIDLVGRDSQSALYDVEWREWLSMQTGIENRDITTDQPVNVAYVSVVAENADVLTGPLAMSFKWMEMVINRKTRRE